MRGALKFFVQCSVLMLNVHRSTCDRMHVAKTAKGLSRKQTELEEIIEARSRHMLISGVTTVQLLVSDAQI